MTSRAEAARRRTTPTVRIGQVGVGSDHPIVVQSMTNTDTADARATANQVAELARAGYELLRITVNTLEAARAVPEIQRRLDMMSCDVPLVGDFHYNGHQLLNEVAECAEILAKYRINPGNVGTKHRDANFTQNWVFPRTTASIAPGRSTRRRANSSRLALPTKTAPASRSRVTTVAS